MSPVLDRMVDRTFHQLEQDSAVVPFEVNGEEFNQYFILVDGIYPEFSRFVKGIKEPITQLEKKYNAQERRLRKPLASSNNSLTDQILLVDFYYFSESDLLYHPAQHAHGRQSDGRLQSILQAGQYYY
jgi:Plant transposon protein